MKMYEKEYTWQTKRRFISINKPGNIYFIYEPANMNNFVVMSNNQYSITYYNYSNMLCLYLPKTKRLVVEL